MKSAQSCHSSAAFFGGGFLAAAAVLVLMMPDAGWAQNARPKPTKKTTTVDATVRPNADGTIVDGGTYGPFDGSPDAWDWTFDDSSFEGAITRATETPQSSIESRLVWEYNLNGLSASPAHPLTATLFFTLRGAPIFPMDPVVVEVYSIPSDLLERTTDYASVPATLQGRVTVPPFQSPTVYSVNVSGPVNAALLNATRKAAFRFQVDSDTNQATSQVFLDALDSDPATKPYLRIVAVQEIEPAGPLEVRP